MKKKGGIKVNWLINGQKVGKTRERKESGSVNRENVRLYGSNAGRNMLPFSFFSQRLKFWYNLPMSQFVYLLFDLWFAVISDDVVSQQEKLVWKDWATMIMENHDITTPCRYGNI